MSDQAIEELKKLLDFNTLKTRGEVKLAPEPDWSLCRDVWVEDEFGNGSWSSIKDHVKIGVRALLANPFFGLFDDMGGMKTAQTIIAAQFLFLHHVIDRVIVVTPPSVRDVWVDKDMGELSLHLFGTSPRKTDDGWQQTLPARVSEYHAKIRQWDWGNWQTSQGRQLRWIVTNYEFIGRSKERMKQLKSYCGPRTLLVLDESACIKNKTALQSKSCLALRKVCGRVVLLNGTPIADTVVDLMNQGNMMDGSILECPYVTTFRERYCVMNPRSDFPQIIGWKNLEDIQRRFAPYVLRRLKEHCLDLPPKLPAVTLDVKLSTEWPHYKSMRDEMVAWISTTHASLAGQAVTKDGRLAQITSGFLGGVEEVYQETDDDMPDFMKEEDWFLKDIYAPDVLTATPKWSKPTFKHVQEVGRAKLNFLLNFYEEHLDQDPAFKLVVWCRFKPELARLMEAMATRFPTARLATLEGGQKRIDRQLALRLLHPRTAIRHEPALLGGITGTGAMGHNFTASHVVVNMSFDFSAFKYRQSSDRNHRPGQTKPVSYYDLVAVGPEGQKTIDHLILKIRRNKIDTSNWVSQAWVDELVAA